MYPRSQPLTQTSLLQASVLPSPTRGEGAATGTVLIFLLPLWEKVAAKLPDEGFYPRRKIYRGANPSPKRVCCRRPCCPLPQGGRAQQRAPPKKKVREEVQ